MADRKTKDKKTQELDEDVKAIVKEGEAGIGTAIQVAEAAERHYFGAVAATTVTPIYTTTSSTW